MAIIKRARQMLRGHGPGARRRARVATGHGAGRAGRGPRAGPGGCQCRLRDRPERAGRAGGGGRPAGVRRRLRRRRREHRVLLPARRPRGGSAGQGHRHRGRVRAGRRGAGQRRLNGFAQIEVVEAAASDSAGEVELMLAEHPGGATISRSDTPPDLIGRRTVTCVTLDGLFAERGFPGPAMVKVDVEGAEFPVLDGMAGLLDTYRPVVLCELDSIDASVLESKIATFHRADDRPRLRGARPVAVLRGCGLERLSRARAHGRGRRRPPVGDVGVRVREHRRTGQPRVQRVRTLAARADASTSASRRTSVGRYVATAGLSWTKTPAGRWRSYVVARRCRRTTGR